MTQRLPGIARGTLAGRIALFAAGMAVACVANAANCSDAPVSNKQYFIANQDSGLQLDVVGASIEPGKAVVQWTGGKQLNQQWTFTETGRGIWTIRAVHSGQALDVYGWGKSDLDPVTQYTYTGNANQQWLLARTSSGAYTITSNYSKLLLTVANKQNGSALHQRADQSSGLQRWYLNPVDGKCSAGASGSFGNFMGSDKILIGGMLDDRTASSAPFDVQYQYLHSRPAPNPACYTNCWKGCNDSPDGGWWGCYGTWNQSESGVYVTWWNDKSANHAFEGRLLPMIQHWTWYSLEDLSKVASVNGRNDYKGAIADQWLLKSYMDDYRFFLKKIGASRAMIHLEPDFWGFVRPQDNNPHSVMAAVRASNNADCALEQDTAAGLASCLISMVRKYAPNATVGLHASCWDWDKPDNGNEGPKACGRYMNELGAGKGDFIATDAADRDAAWAVQNDPKWGHLYWWDDARFNTYVNVIKTLTESVGKPMVIWQIHLGNNNQNNTKNHWKDNKVDYMFNRINDLANAHVAVLLFGAGHHEQTSTETDGGYMANKANAYYRNGGVRLR